MAVSNKKRCWLVNYFSVYIEMVMWYLSFILLMGYVKSVDIGCENKLMFFLGIWPSHLHYLLCAKSSLIILFISVISEVMSPPSHQTLVTWIFSPFFLVSLLKICQYCWSFWRTNFLFCFTFFVIVFCFYIFVFVFYFALIFILPFFLFALDLICPFLSFKVEN